MPKTFDGWTTASPMPRLNGPFARRGATPAGNRPAEEIFFLSRWISLLRPQHICRGTPLYNYKAALNGCCQCNTAPPSARSRPMRRSRSMNHEVGQGGSSMSPLTFCESCLRARGERPISALCSLLTRVLGCDQPRFEPRSVTRRRDSDPNPIRCARNSMIFRALSTEHQNSGVNRSKEFWS